DQTFNILMGRTLQKAFGLEQQVALFLPILEGLDGREKMSKSLNNYIGIYESAQTMFKKVMEVPDALILRYYELATDEHPDTIAQIRADLARGANPRDSKYRLAQIITGLYHSPADAARAKDYYDAAFAAKGIPQQLPTLQLHSATLIGLFPALVEAGYATGTSALRRLLAQGGIQLNQQKVTDPDAALHAGDVLKLGKKTFVRLVDNA
ncbi:MAG: tyrosine--tRNA ligase, partial [Eubacteriales bacterium]|nr:tyrosine--tRNA ligase [Eubacteriales bacterium]